MCSNGIISPATVLEGRKSILITAEHETMSSLDSKFLPQMRRVPYLGG